MSTFEAPNDYRNYLCHYGVKGMKRPSGLKYKKRNGQTLREHRLEQARKVGALDEMREDRDRRIREREEARQIDHEHNIQDHNHRAERSDREAYIREMQAHDEEKRRQQEALERHRQHEAEVLANTKGKGSAIRTTNSHKRMQNFANQLGIMTPGRHQSMHYQQQIENRRRRRHGH